MNESLLEQIVQWYSIGMLIFVVTMIPRILRVLTSRRRSHYHELTDLVNEYGIHPVLAWSTLFAVALCMTILYSLAWPVHLLSILFMRKP